MIRTKQNARGQLEWLHSIIDNTNPRVTHILGVDESGTGAFAGSFFSSAVLTPRYWEMGGVKDSKKTTARGREELIELLDVEVIYHAEAAGTVADIETYGQADAWVRSMVSAISSVLNNRPKAIAAEHIAVVIDGNGNSALRDQLRSTGVLTMFVVKADTFVPAVSAASIFAKYHRDVEMNLLDKEYPQYNFNANAGYGTEEHRTAIKKYGRIPQVHRPCTTKRS